MLDWMERIIRIEDSKNGDARELPFSGELEAALREAHAKHEPREKCFSDYTEQIVAASHGRHFFAA